MEMPEIPKIDLALIVLVLIGIIVSSVTVVYTASVLGNVSTVSSDVSTLKESVANLTSSISELTDIIRTLASTVNMSLEKITALESRLLEIEASLAAKETLIVGTTDSVELTLDPAQAYDYFGWCILQQIAGTLVSVKPGSKTGTDYVAELAKSWNYSSDLKVWDFTLRDDVTFPDGTTFNATHVKYSFDRAIELIPAIPEGAPAGLGYDAIIENVTVLDTYKVRFYLKTSFSPFLGILACRASAIVDPKYAPIAQVNYTEGDARASTPVAFVGPYVLSKWVRVGGKDQEIRLDANPNYWTVASGYPK
ncbi:MAG: ABC transporter substrate-binding protein, partial [Candidatus Bathyarchaeia archaeon]